MKKIGKKSIIGLVILAIFLVAVFFPGKPVESDFGITYIGYAAITEQEKADISDAVTKAIKGIGGYENAVLEFNEVVVPQTNDTSLKHDMALTQLWEGSGVIYIAPYKLIRSLIDDEELFASLPESLEADVVSESGRSIAIDVTSLPSLNLKREKGELCVFVRSDEIENEAQKDYIVKNQKAAIEVLRMLKNTCKEC